MKCRGLLALVAILGLALSPAGAETLLQLNGMTSYIEASGFDGAVDGVFSLGLWFWPERSSASLEALASLSTTSKSTSMTVGWVNSTVYYTDRLKVVPEVSEHPIARQTWHYLVLTLEEVNRDVFFEAFATSRLNDTLVESRVVHRLGKVYVDGVVVLTFESRLPMLTAAHVTVGRDYMGMAPQRYFTGLVDELRVYNDTLTPTQIQTLSFVKPLDAEEAASFKLNYYAHFNDIAINDTLDLAVPVMDLMTSMTASPIRTTVHFCDKVTVAVMPYDPIPANPTVARANPFQNADYLTNRTGPLKGSTLTVTGYNFANTDFLAVFLEDLEGHSEAVEFEYVDTATLIVHLPRRSLALGESFKDFTVHVTNGGLPGSYTASFPFRYEYVLGEDWEDHLQAHYRFEGDLTDAAHRDVAAAAARILPNFGQGGPYFTHSRSLYPMQALQFMRGERLQMPVLLGAKPEWSFCAWVYADRNARTLYYERDAAATTVANLIELDADGVLHLDKQPSAALVHDAWQFICVVKGEERADFYISGLHKASAASAPPAPVTLAMGLLGTNWTGAVDDVWVLNRALEPYDVMRMFVNEEFVAVLDGEPSSRFTVTNAVDASANNQAGARYFDSADWRAGSFSIQMWVKPSSVEGTQPLLYQPSMVPSAASAQLSVQNYDGTYFAIVGGALVFFGLADQGAVAGGAATNDFVYTATEVNGTMFPVVEAGEWSWVGVVFDTNSIVLSVNGVPQQVTCGTADCTRHTLGVTSVLEASTKPMYIGYGKQYDLYEGYFSGSLGEVALWSKALTDGELYSACPPVPHEAGMYAYFKMGSGVRGAQFSGMTPDLRMTFSGSKRPFYVQENYTVGEDRYKTDTTTYSLSMVDGEGVQVGDIDVENRFTFQARDQCSRLHKYEANSSMQVIVSGPLDLHLNYSMGEIRANGDGTYTGRYTLTYCGWYEVRVETTGVPVPSDSDGDWNSVFVSGRYDKLMAKGSPFRMYIHPGATAASLSYAYDTPDLLANDDLLTAYYGVPASFILQAVDKTGCRRTTGGDSFDVMLTGRNALEGMVQDNANGTYTVTYVPHLEGLTQLHVTLNGEHVATAAPEDPKDTDGISLGTQFSGSPWLISVQQGNGSLYVDGASGAEAASADQLHLRDSFTMEAFVFPMAPFSNGRIVSKESPVGGRGYYVAVEEMRVMVSLYVGGLDPLLQYRTLQSAGMLKPEQWNHVAVTYDGVTLKLYLDGVADASAAFEGLKEVKENTQKLRIGTGFHGLIDELRLMAMVKTEAQVMEQMMCPMDSSQVLVYFMFNDGAGEVAFDYSQFGSHATLVGRPANSSMSPWYDANAPNGVNVLDFTRSDLSGEGLSQARAGMLSSFTMALRDACGFDYVVQDEIEVTMDLTQTTLFTDTRGAAECPHVFYEDLGEVRVMHEPSVVGIGPVLVSYEPERCGEARIHVRVDGRSPAASPFPVHITPAAEASANATSASGMASEVVAGLEASFTITARDRFGCRRTSGGDVLAVTLTRTSAAGGVQMRGPDVVSAVLTPEDHMDGTYTVYYVAPAAGRYTLDVGVTEAGVGTMHVQGSPHRFVASASPWRETVLGGAMPVARTDPTTAVYGDDMYVFRGWGSDKSAVPDVWRFPLDRSETKQATWAYRTLVTVTNLKASHEVKVTVDTASLIDSGKMRFDCADVMFLPTDALPGAAPLGYYLDMFPGCNSDGTGFWIEALEREGTFQVYMYYGNVHAESSAVPGGDILRSFDDFEGESPMADGWRVAETCTMQKGDETAFTYDGFVSVSGEKALRVDAKTKAGGALVKELAPMDAYVLKGFLFDSDASSSSNWFSPSYEDCKSVDDKLLLAPSAAGLGVFTCAAEEYMAMLYPWTQAGPRRSCAWHALELVCNGTDTRYYIDGEYLGSRPAQALNKIFISGGATPRGEETFESVAAWDSVYVAAFDEGVAVGLGAEEPVVFTQSTWSPVETKGTPPPTSRTTESAVTHDGKLYMLGGYGNAESDGLVWYFDFRTSRWGSKTPAGSRRLPSRQHQSLALYDGTIYAFGGRTGSMLFNDLYAYDIADNAWSTVSNATGPSPRWGHSAVVYKDTMFVFGGMSHGNPSSETWGFDLRRNVWMDLTPTMSPPARFSHTIALMDDSMFLYGGSTNAQRLEDSWKYDFDYNTWSNIAPVSDLGSTAARSETALAAYNNTLYVFGGSGTKSVYQDLWSLAIY